MLGCNESISQRTRFSLKSQEYRFKEDFLQLSWNNICDHHYHTDLYRRKHSSTHEAGPPVRRKKLRMTPTGAVPLTVAAVPAPSVSQQASFSFSSSFSSRQSGVYYGEQQDKVTHLYDSDVSSHSGSDEYDSADENDPDQLLLRTYTVDESSSSSPTKQESQQEPQQQQQQPHRPTPHSIDFIIGSTSSQEIPK